MEAITKKSLIMRIGIFAILIAMVLSMGMPIKSYAEPYVTENDGSITIHKYLLADGTSPSGTKSTGQTGDAVNLPAGATGLDGIKFTVTQVDTTSGGSKIFAFEGTDYYKTTGGYEQTLTTANGGLAETNDIPLGIYLVKEEPSDLVSSPVAPFLVWIPTTVQGSGEDTLIYDINVYPKNSKALDIGKVAVPGGQAITNATTGLPVNIGDEVDFYITASIPADIDATGVTYSLWDDYPAGMDMKAGSVVVKAGAGTNASDFGTTLIPNTDYTVSDTPASLGVNGGGKLIVSLTDAGRAKVSGMVKIQVKLTTTILASIPMNQRETNEATIDYTDKNGDTKKIDTDNPGTDSPDVFNGGFSLLKKDANGGAALQGAKFKLVKRLTSDFNADLATAKNGGNPAADATTDGYYQLSTNANHNAANALTVTSDSNGYAAFKNIPYGSTGDAYETAHTDFWLVEIKSPNGYRLLDSPVKITVNKDSYNESTGLTVPNSKGFEFPLTGGMGTLIFVVGGIVLIGLAGVVIVSSRRKSGSAAR
ncbi:MAG: SpaH/EbpB family LPXTG-anchored major pilin [Clostridiales Family XIII bacterium]|jgi:fimbrial isopeptide formation D2 family protein/LPXTG-motif cell wall-anchored protein|nr:SpaH/EbpB family LPXTG-anchored major pilin [Clostridiales Family XIII bacterium]